jgi:hypothetical protein
LIYIFLFYSKITEVIDDESDEEVKWALDSRLVVEKYDIS